MLALLRRRSNGVLIAILLAMFALLPQVSLVRAATAVVANTNNAGAGGGINTDSTVNLTNVTITNNTATNGGGDGIYANAGTLTIQNTIISGNTASFSGPDCEATLNSLGNNLIWNTSNCTINGPTTGNITGGNAMLGTLLNNGGATKTHHCWLGAPRSAPRTMVRLRRRISAGQLASRGRILISERTNRWWPRRFLG